MFSYALIDMRILYYTLCVNSAGMRPPTAADIPALSAFAKVMADKQNGNGRRGGGDHLITCSVLLLTHCRLVIAPP